VCVFVGLSANISLESLDQFPEILCALPGGRGSVLIWRRCNMLCTSGFMDGVTLGHSGPYDDALKAKPLT